MYLQFPPNHTEPLIVQDEKEHFSFPVLLFVYF